MARPSRALDCQERRGLRGSLLKVTRNRNNEIVTINEVHYIAGGYCAVAHPYWARYKSNRPRFAFGDCSTEAEAARFDACRLGGAPKRTLGMGRIDAGLAQGWRPGVDADATPACALGRIVGGAGLC